MRLSISPHKSKQKWKDKTSQYHIDIRISAWEKYSPILNQGIVYLILFACVRECARAHDCFTNSTVLWHSSALFETYFMTIAPSEVSAQPRDLCNLFSLRYPPEESWLYAERPTKGHRERECYTSLFLSCFLRLTAFYRLNIGTL